MPLDLGQGRDRALELAHDRDISTALRWARTAMAPVSFAEGHSQYAAAMRLGHHPRGRNGHADRTRRSSGVCEREPMTPKTLRQLAAAQRAIAEALEHEADAAEQAPATQANVAPSPIERDWIRDTVGQLPRLATVFEIAQTLRMSARNVHRLVARGRLLAVRTGMGGSSRVLVPRAELVRFLSTLQDSR